MVVIDSLVLDVSNYDWDTFNAKAFYTAGVRRAIVGSQQPSISGQMVEALRSEGIEVIGSYDLPYFGSDDTTLGPAERLAKFVTDYRIPFAWADAEIDANQTNVKEWKNIPTPSVAQRQQEFRCFTNTVERAAPFGVYTNAGWWNPNMGGSTEWASSPLWLATYGVGGSAIPPIDSVDFGGWTTPLLHQYTSTHVINNRVRDMSYLFAATGVEDDMSQADKDAIAKLQIQMAMIQQGIQDFKLSVFSGNEDRADTLDTRIVNADYRIIQRASKAEDGTALGSVNDTIASAVKAMADLAVARGMTEAEVRSYLTDELTEMLDAAKASLH